jgi:intracellular sulfur oxidation DsrE/DsrF family protein
MKLRSMLALSVLGSTLSLLPTTAAAQAKAHHVLFAVTSADEADWHLAMGNMRNLISGLPPDSVEVELVAFGPGLNIVKKGSSVEEDIKKMEEKHVTFVACQNAMRAQHITGADLIDGVGQVPAGIIEVVTKQEQNWVYIKAGR